MQQPPVGNAEGMGSDSGGFKPGATLLLGWIPLIGVLAALYGACVYAIGLRRLHGLPPLRVGAALLIPAVPSLAVAVVISVFAYNATRTLAQGPASYYFPPPEAQKDLPPAPSGLWR